MGLNDDVLVLCSAQDEKDEDVDAIVAATVGLRVVGYSARESAGTADVATFNIINGATGATGTEVAMVELAANESVREWLWPGVDCRNGLSLEIVSGTASVCIYYAIMHPLGGGK